MLLLRLCYVGGLLLALRSGPLQAQADARAPYPTLASSLDYQLGISFVWLDRLALPGGKTNDEKYNYSNESLGQGSQSHLSPRSWQRSV